MNPEVNSHRKVHHIFLIKRWFKLRCIVLETFLVCQFLSWTQVIFTLFDVSSRLKWIVYKDTPLCAFEEFVLAEMSVKRCFNDQGFEFLRFVLLHGNERSSSPPSSSSSLPLCMLNRMPP